MGSLILLAQDAGEAIALGGGLMMIVMVILAIVSVVAWIWALINAIQNPALDSTMRIIWVLVIVFTGIVGAIIYLLIGRGGAATHARV